MNEVLERLKEILKATTEDKFKLIDIMTDTEALMLMRTDKVPALTLQSVGEDHVPTGTALLMQRIYKIKLKMWYQQIKQNNARTIQTGFKNVFEASNLIETILFKDKKLNNIVNGMNDSLIMTDWNLAVEEGGISKLPTVWVGRDFEFSYYQFITYQGKENSQPTTSLPVPNESCNYLKF